MNEVTRGPAVLCNINKCIWCVWWEGGYIPMEMVKYWFPVDSGMLSIYNIYYYPYSNHLKTFQR